jgi:hypothetical protein
MSCRFWSSKLTISILFLLYFSNLVIFCSWMISQMTSIAKKGHTDWQDHSLSASENFLFSFLFAFFDLLGKVFRVFILSQSIMYHTVIDMHVSFFFLPSLYLVILLSSFFVGNTRARLFIWWFFFYYFDWIDVHYSFATSCLYVCVIVVFICLLTL